MSNHTRKLRKIIPPLSISFNNQNNQDNNYNIPLLKPVPLHTPNPYNEQKMRQIYQSSSHKSKQKQKQSKSKNNKKYILPLYNKNKNTGEIQNSLIQNHQESKMNRYKDYLDSQIKNYQKNHNKNKDKKINQNGITNNNNNLNYTTNLNKNNKFKNSQHVNISLNSQLLTNYKKSINNKIFNYNVQPKSNNRYVFKDQQQANIYENSKNNSKNRNFYSRLDQQQNEVNFTTRNRKGSNLDLSSNDKFKIRKSTKKSLSGSISKKPSQVITMRQETKFQKIYRSNKNYINQSTPNQISIHKNDVLQQGKQYFKKGNLTQALIIFQKGSQNNPQNLNFQYNIAMIYLKQHNYQEGLKFLDQIINKNPNFKKTIYLFAAISCKHLNNIQKAIQYADKGLKMHNNFTDLLFYRAKIFKENNQKDKAIEDLKYVIKLQKDHIEALYLLSFLMYEKNLLNNCLSSLSSAIFYDQDKNSQYRKEALKLRAQIYLSQGKIKQAKKDILKLKSQKQKQNNNNNVNNCQIYYLLGRLQVMQNNISDALISFQKCLREQKIDLPTQQNPKILIFSQLFTHQSIKINSLIEICKTKINIKDFYSALHHITRAKYLNLDQKNTNLLQFKYFIQGVIFLMKRKVDQAMKNFEKFNEIEVKIKQNIIESQEKTIQQKIISQSNKYFYPMIYLYRAYGYFMQNKHDLAIKDYQQYQQYVTLDKYTLYNLLLAKGITKIHEEKFNQALDYFNKSQQIFINSMNKIEPYIYRAITYIEEGKLYKKKIDKNQTPKNSPVKINKKNRKIIDKIEKNNSQNLDSDIQVLQLIFNGLKQLDKAYDLNDGSSNLLFIRCLVYAYLGKYDQALEDIIKAISKSQQNIPKYFFIRAMIQETIDNKKQAVNDFNICLNLDPDLAVIYIQRAKLYFNTENYSKALQDLIKYAELIPQQDIEYHKACMYLINELYPLAQEATQLIKEKNNEKFQYLMFFISIKQGKIIECYNYLLKNYQTDRILLNILTGNYTDLYTADNKDNNNIKSFKSISSSKMKYFNLIHYHNLLGVAFFNQNEYSLALEQFNIALRECNLRDMQNSAVSFKNINGELINPFNSSQVQANLLRYNIFLCHLQLGQIKKAYEIFVHQIMDNRNFPIELQRQHQILQHFMHLLFKSMKKSSNIKNKFNSDQKNHQKIFDMNNEQNIINNDLKQQIHLEIFTNLFTEIFSEFIQIQVQNGTFILKTKLCMLNLECDNLKREYLPRLTPQYVLKWLTASQVQNRPEPPWVKRQNSIEQGLIFTDNIQNINIQFQTTQQDESQQQINQSGQQNNQQQQDQQQEQQGQQASNNNNNNQNQYQQNKSNQSQSNNFLQESKQKFDPKKFKALMKLNDSIQRKLNKIVKKNNNQDTL